MPARIPRRIRENVVTEWLKGMPRDENAKINGIGCGTVSIYNVDVIYNQVPIFSR